ncbi:MAG: hypothetical protein EBV92_08425, partial [Betaproteobacteria bacterium]|nr:hypothetical protein [Betaproteobacteria bacterium]
ANLSFASVCFEAEASGLLLLIARASLAIQALSAFVNRFELACLIGIRTCVQGRMQMLCQSSFYPPAAFSTSHVPTE